MGRERLLLVHKRLSAYRVGKDRLTVVSMETQSLFYKQLLVNYCIIFHTNTCKPRLAPPM